MTTNGQTTVETTTTINYYIRSSVLGGKPVVEVGTTGTQTDGYIYAAGALLAKQTNLCQNCSPSVIWQEANPLTGSRFEANTSGSGNLQERDPLGANTGAEDPWLYNDEPDYLNLIQPEQSLLLDGGYDPFNPGGCELNGMPYSCDRLERDIENGSVAGDVFRGGRFDQQISLVGRVNFGRGFISVLTPGNNRADTPPGGDPNTTYGTRDTWETYYIPVFQSSQRQTRQPHDQQVSRVKDESNESSRNSIDVCIVTLYVSGVDLSGNLSKSSSSKSSGSKSGKKIPKGSTGVANHLYITTTDSNIHLGFRGGEDENGNLSASGVLYDERFEDYETDPVAVGSRVSRGECEAINKSFRITTNLINNANIDYNANNNNSNAVVYTLLSRAGLDPDSFTPSLNKAVGWYGFYWGWGINLPIK